jgi:hypothetical protein
MNERSVESSSLYCVVEKQLFYFGILSGNKLVKSDQVKLNNGFTLFESPEVIIQFLKRTLHNFNISRAYFSFAGPDYTIVPKAIEIEDLALWLGREVDDSYKLITNDFNHTQITFPVPKLLLSELGPLFNTFEFHHIVETNLQHGLPSDGILSYRIDGFQLVGMVEEGQLQYQNLTPSSSVLSGLYYSLLPYHMLSRDLKQLPLYTIKHSQELHDHLENYVANVELLDHKLDVVSKTELNQSQLYQIQRLQECVS